MSRHRSHISLLLLTVVLTGSLLSFIHTHDRPLDHTGGNELQNQLVESNLFCPICATVVFLVNEEATPHSRLADQQEPVLIYSDLLVSDFYDSKILGRAPPLLA